jgi:tetratricopeptide (TPR) repeat protein
LLSMRAATFLRHFGPVAVRFAVLAGFVLGVGLAPQSDHVRRWLAAGDGAARDGDYDTARQAYGRVLSYADPHPAIYKRLVQMSLDEHDYDAARIYLYALADLDGWTDARREQLRVVLQAEGEIAQVSALTYASLVVQEDNPRALRDIVHQQIEALDWPAAQNTLEALLKLVPEDGEALYYLGLLAAPTDHTLATDYLARAAVDQRWAAQAAQVGAALAGYGTYSLTDAHTYLGVTLVGLGEWPFAERAFEAALATNAVNPTALAYLGFTRDQQARDGLPDLEAALAMAPNDPTVHYLLGHHWRLVQDHPRAYDAFSQAYWLDSDNPALAAEVGTSLQNLGEMADAEEWLRLAVDLAPEDVHWRRLLATFYADTGFGLEARGLAFIEETSRAAPDDPDIHASLGWAFQRMGETQQAYEELNTAVGIDPSNPRSRYYFGVVLEYMGDRQGAADSYWFVVETAGPDTRYGLLATRALQRLGHAPS